MRYLFLFLASFFLVTSCTKSDDDTPTLRYTGAGVMRCTINGQDWEASPRRFGFEGVTAQYGSSQNSIQVLGHIDADPNITPFSSFSVFVDDPLVGEKLIAPDNEFLLIVDYTPGSREEYTHLPAHPDNWLIVDRLDLDARILGGRFAGVAVSNISSDTLIIENGFFDVTF